MVFFCISTFKEGGFMANYPEWVKKFRRKGTAIKKVGNSYYLYKHTSKCVPGKNNILKQLTSLLVLLKKTEKKYLLKILKSLNMDFRLLFIQYALKNKRNHLRMNGLLSLRV